MALMQMAHEKDPRQEIEERVKSYIDNIQLTGPQVLLGIYVRPQKTKGGVILTEAYRDEDVYQGKAALILKMGPHPWDQDDDNFFGNRLPQVGDWVVYRPSDGFPMDFGDKQKCRILSDRRQIKMIISSPDVVW